MRLAAACTVFTAHVCGEQKMTGEMSIMCFVYTLSCLLPGDVSQLKLWGI